MKSIQAFTIIEILVAILIFGVLTTALSMTLTGSLKLNQQSQDQLSTTSGTQRVMEDIRQSWLNQANYDLACVPNLSLPDKTYQVKFVNLSSRAEPITQSNTVASSSLASSVPENAISTASPCTASTNALLTGGTVPNMRRIIVRSGTGDQDTALSLDVVRP